MKLKQHLLLALIVTILLTIALVAGPGASSGYGGVFFIMISPILWVAFLLWGLSLQWIAQKHQLLSNIVAYVLLTFSAIAMVVFAMLTFSSDPDIRSISYAEIFLDKQVLLFFLSTAIGYGFLFWLFKRA